MNEPKQTLLDQAKKIPVPEPGEIITIQSVELLCTWMKLNHRKVLRWQGNLLVTVRETETVSLEKVSEGSRA